MFRPRVIPVLLLRDGALVKSVRFKNHRYIGDAVNAVRIFNDLRADELVFLDIDASKAGRCISVDFVRQVGEEADMPFAVGGGICSIEQIGPLIAAGAEKVVLCSQAASNPKFVREACEAFGSSTIVVCMDVRKKLLRGPRVWTLGGSRATRYAPVDFAQLMEAMGAGELVVQSVEQDGTMRGYDIPLIRSVSDSVTIPVIALGGAGGMAHLADAYRSGRATGLAAGSLFVFHGPRRGVLISYPERADLQFRQVTDQGPAPSVNAGE